VSDVSSDGSISDDIHALRRLKAPSLAAFEVMAEIAYARLPQRFRALCGNLVIRVEDFPTDEVMDEMEAETPFDPLGRVVTHVLIHEIGHHFGLSDDDMERLEAEAG